MLAARPVNAGDDARTNGGRTVIQAENELDAENELTRQREAAASEQDALIAGEGALSVAKAAQYLGCGATYLYRLIGRAEVASYKLGRRTIVPRAALRAYVAAKTAERLSALTQ
ncbi:MAG: hypothetical protein JWO85_1212 [Candidatus Eremiobacteraeota bacterium]|nr:hypothetical protein [Candidatus Eremiobacteraeota bacterium]